MGLALVIWIPETQDVLVLSPSLSSLSLSALAVSVSGYRWVFSMGQSTWPQKAPGSHQITFDFRKRAYPKRFSGKDFDWLGLGHVSISGPVTATSLSKGFTEQGCLSGVLDICTRKERILWKIKQEFVLQRR